MKIVWLKAAEADLDQIFDYLFTQSPQSALHVYHTIRRRVELLSDHPHLGRPGRVEKTRELGIGGTPYIAAYTVDNDADSVVILRVLHGRRLWPEEFGAE